MNENFTNPIQIVLPFSFLNFIDYALPTLQPGFISQNSLFFEQNLLNTLKDATKYPEWHIGVHKVKYITMAPELDSNNKARSKNTMSTHVLNDVVSVETDVSSSQMIQFINKVSEKLQGDSLIRKIHLINRYQHFKNIRIVIHEKELLMIKKRYYSIIHFKRGMKHT